jgi:hypothetical protein
MRKRLPLQARTVLRIGMYILMAFGFLACYGVFAYMDRLTAITNTVNRMRWQSNEDRIKWFGEDLERPKEDYIAIAERSIDEGFGPLRLTRDLGTTFSFIAGCIGLTFVWLIFQAFKVLVFPELPDPKATHIEPPPRQS